MALTGLKSKAKYVRSELGRRMKLRLTPEIRFIEDESLERGSRVSNSNISYYSIDWFWGGSLLLFMTPMLITLFAFS